MAILMDFDAFTMIPMWGSIHPARDLGRGAPAGELGVELKEEKVKYREREGEKEGNKKGKRKEKETEKRVRGQKP
jgi:hypothetical protein